MNKSTLLLIAVLFLGLGGCSAGKEYAYNPSSETPPGPGLFSGENGVFTVYERKLEDDPVKKDVNSQETP